MELALKCSAMILFLFQVLEFCSEVVYTLVPGTDQVATNPKRSHFDCEAMKEITLDALNQVRQCRITPVDLEISQTKSILHNKIFWHNLLQQIVGYNNEKLTLRT